MAKNFDDGVLALAFGENKNNKEIFINRDLKSVFEVEYKNGKNLMKEAIMNKEMMEMKNGFVRVYLGSGMGINEINERLSMLFSGEKYEKLRLYESKVKNYKYIEKTDDEKWFVEGEKMTMEEKKFITLIFLHECSNDEDDRHYIFTSMIGLVSENWNKISFIKMARKIYQAETYKKDEYVKSRKSNSMEIVERKFDVLELINPICASYIWLWIKLYQHFYSVENFIPIPKKEEMIFTIFHFAFYKNPEMKENKNFVMAIIHEDVEGMKKEAKGKNRFVIWPIMSTLGVDEEIKIEVCDECEPVKVVAGKPLVADF